MSSSRLAYDGCGRAMCAGRQTAKYPQDTVNPSIVGACHMFPAMTLGRIWQRGDGEGESLKGDQSESNSVLFQTSDGAYGIAVLAHHGIWEQRGCGPGTELFRYRQRDNQHHPISNRDDPADRCNHERPGARADSGCPAERHHYRTRAVRRTPKADRKGPPCPICSTTVNQEKTS
jgi:hypothetical protein